MKKKIYIALVTSLVLILNTNFIFAEVVDLDKAINGPYHITTKDIINVAIEFANFIFLRIAIPIVVIFVVYKIVKAISKKIKSSKDKGEKKK